MKQQSLKTAKARIWTVNGQDFTSKSVAYRYARTLNGKKVSGNKPHNVQRKNA